MTGGTSSMGSILRAFDVVDLLQETDGVGPSQVAAQMDLPTSTAHVYLQTLAETGYLVNDDGTYRLSYKFLAVGSRTKRQNTLFRVSEDLLRDLAERTEEHVTLVVEEAGKAVVLHKAIGDRALDLGIYSGMSHPIHTTATGKTILAYLPEERTDEIVETHGLTGVTDETITDEETLRAELAAIREEGYAVDWDQQAKGMGLIAVPVFFDDRLAGAVGIACPTGRIRDEEYRETLLQKLRETVDSITIRHRYGD